jgi:hypothetical protein
LIETPDYASIDWSRLSSGGYCVSNLAGWVVRAEGLSFFAPKRLQEAVRATRLDRSSRGFDKPREDSLSQSEPVSNASDESLAMKCFRVPRLFEVTQPLEPAPVSRFSSAISILWRLALAIAVLAGLAFLVAGKPWTMRTIGANERGSESSVFSSLFLAQARAEPAHDGVATLSVTPATPRRMGEAVPLGVSIRNSVDVNLFLRVAGLVQGARLSAGFALSVDKWGLFATDLKNVMVQPPPTFVGAMNLTVELFIADAAPVDRQILHFEWMNGEVPEAKMPEAQPKSEAIDKLPSEQIAQLLKRGNDLISSGDLAAARLVLKRAAQAGDARAALALAGTYDPVTLQRFPVHGLSPDLAMARHWYEKAKELGSPDALGRLEMLARRPD